MSVCHICSARPCLKESLYTSGLISVLPSHLSSFILEKIFTISEVELALEKEGVKLFGVGTIEGVRIPNIDPTWKVRFD